MREEVIQKIEKEKIVVIVRGVEKEKVIPLAEAMYKGGIRLLEVTYSADASVSDAETAETIKMLVEHFAGRMCIGAGTVLTEKQVEFTKKAGGQFIISPDTAEKVIRKTRELGMVSMPGALTPSEIQAAHTYGADFVKLFPAAALGTAYIKAVSAPLSHIKFLAVGGIDENNILEYVRAGVCGFGVATGIVDKNLLAAEAWDAITALAKKYTEVLK